MNSDPSNAGKDKLSKFWFIVSNALPPIGFFIYFKHRREFPDKAQNALKSALIGIPVAMVVGYLMNSFILN